MSHLPVRRKNSDLLKILPATGIVAFLGYLGFPYITQAPRVITENALPTEININQPIPITFSQVMNGKSTENNIHISPDMPFAYEWHGKKLFLKLSEPQEDETIISIHISENIKNLIGRKMSKDTDIEFIIKKHPRISHIYPENTLRANESIYVTFSEEMIDQKNPIIQKTPTIEPPVKGSWEWITPSTMKFSPSENYQQSITYNIIVPKGIKNIRGIPTQEDAIRTFKTEKNEIIKMDEWHGIVTKPLGITFSQPIETSRIKNCIKIAEENHVLEDIKIVQLEDGNEYVVKIMPIDGWQKDRNYKITVKPGAPYDHEEKKEMTFTANQVPDTLEANAKEDVITNEQEIDLSDKSVTSSENKNEISIKFNLPHSFEISENAEQKSIKIITKNISEIIVEACDISEKTLAIITAHELLEQIPLTKICKKYGSEKREISPSQQEEETEIKISDLIKKEGEKSLYLLRATDLKTGKSTTSVIIPSKLKIFAKKSPEDTLVWIQNQNNQSTQIRGYNANGELLFAENTNNNGILYQQNLKQPLSILFAETEDQLGFLNTEWQQSIHPSEYGQQIILQESSLDIFTITDKDTYSANETIYMAGIARKKEGSSIKVPTNRSIHIAIRDAENFEIYRKQVNMKDGFFSNEMKLFEDTTEGIYTLIICDGFLGQYCEGNESYSFFHVGENKTVEKTKDNTDNNSKENKNRLNIQFDKEKYQIGDEARIRFHYDKENIALVTVERQGIRNFHTLETRPGFNATTLPITENLIPNAFVSIVIPHESTYDISYKEFEIEKNAKRIKVNASVNKKTNTENEYIVNIKTRNYQNEPLNTRIIIALSEKENNALETSIENRIIDYFFNKKGLGVLNTSNMTRNSNYEFGEEVCAQNSSGSSMMKNIKETLFWSSELQTNENGEMEYSVQIPGKKIMSLHVLAISNKTEIGYAEIPVDTRDILTIGTSIPDRVYSGDQFFITPLITNMKNKEKITVNLETSSLRVIGQNEISMQIKPGEEKKISFHIEAPAVNRKISEEIIITAKTENYSEQKKIKISLLPTDLQSKINIVGNLSGQSTKEFIPNLEKSKNQKIDIYVGTSELAFIMNTVEELLSKQIGTTEEMMSRIWPLAIIIKNSGMESFQNLSLPQLRDSNQQEITVKDIIENTLDIIIKSQNQDGGWAYYWNMEKNTQSDVATSAYIFAGLGAIKKSGFKINNAAYQKAYSFVTKNLYTLENNQKDTAAFIVAMLTETDRYEIGSMQKLLKEKNMLSTGGKLYLATALYNAELKEEAKKILDELLEETHISKNSARLYSKNNESPILMMSDVKRTSLLIMLMNNIYPQSAVINNAIKWIATKSSNTLHEQAHVIRATVSAMKNPNNIELYTEIIFNNNQKNSIKKNIDSGMINEKISFSKYLKQAPYLNEATIIAKNSHPLFYCITSFFSNSANQSKASSKELGIARTYSKLAESSEKEKTQAMEVGNKITGLITIIVPSETNFVTIREPIPGGLKFLTATTENKYLKIAAMNDNTLTLVAEKLEPRVYTFEYITEATTSGTFFHAPATISEQYGTKKEGSTLPSWITIKNL